MKKTLVFLSITLIVASTVWTQEIFDAIRKGDVTAAKALVAKTPSLVDARDANGMTPLHFAANGGDAGLVHFLVDKGAKLELKNAQGKTPLHIAAMNDRGEAAAALLRRGASLEAKDDYDRTALVLCAREMGGAATARVLIAAGADVNAVDRFGDTALSLAAWRGKAEVIDLLLGAGAKVPAEGGKWGTLVWMSASQGLTALFRRLMAGAQDVAAADPSRTALLAAAAAGGSVEIIQALLDKGFEATRADRFGWTPLHYAARDGRVEAVRFLAEKGASTDARTIMGQTPYNVAREREMDGVAAFLAEKRADTSGIRFPELKGDYLGEAPPGETPKLFGLGIVSSIWGLHSTAVFSPSGDEVCWSPMVEYPGETYSRGGVMLMKRSGGRWSAPAFAPFSGPHTGDDVPFFTADGKRVFFISRRPLPGETENRRERIWFADRTASGWSEPQPVDAGINEHAVHWEFSLDRDGDLYFGGGGTDSRGRSDIFLARFVNGKYERPVNLGDPINTSDEETTPFIAPDGSYLLFSRQYDLWASFRGPDGKWAEPIKFGPGVNSEAIELCPMVTADGKYLFFLSQREGESHVYWVSTSVIEKLRPGRSGSVK